TGRRRQRPGDRGAAERGGLRAAATARAFQRRRRAAVAGAPGTGVGAAAVVAPGPARVLAGRLGRPVAPERDDAAALAAARLGAGAAGAGARLLGGVGRQW